MVVSNKMVRKFWSFHLVGCCRAALGGRHFANTCANATTFERQAITPELATMALSVAKQTVHHHQSKIRIANRMFHQPPAAVSLLATHCL